MTDKQHNNKPLWFKTICTISIITVLSWPLMMQTSAPFDEPENPTNLLLLLFPIYAVLSLYLAYKTYDERPAVSNVLLVVLWLAFIAIWFI